MERAMPQGRWWNNPEMVQKLSVTPEQVKKMDDIFQQNRLRLIDLNANLQREEVTMEPLMAADTPDEPKILAQIDKIAQARAELEKANARFLLGIRRILTQEQWKKLREHCRVRRFWAGEPDEIGHVLHRPGGPVGGTWAFRYDIRATDDDADDDEAGYRFAAHPFVLGEYVSIRDEDGELHTFVVVSVEPVT